MERIIEMGTALMAPLKTCASSLGQQAETYAGCVGAAVWLVTLSICPAGQKGKERKGKSIYIAPLHYE